MKFSLVIIISITLFTLISCSQAKQDSAQTQQAPALTQNEVQSTPGNVSQSVKGITGEQSSAAEVMLNPPHGEPNHRCDIPVGAPLNSPPTNNTLGTTNNQIQTMSPKNSNTAPNISNNPTGPTIENARQMTSSQKRMASPTTGTKPRFNPPHGKPWHRCEIAVGSPLPN